MTGRPCPRTKGFGRSTAWCSALSLVAEVNLVLLSARWGHAKREADARLGRQHSSQVGTCLVPASVKDDSGCHPGRQIDGLTATSSPDASWNPGQVTARSGRQLNRDRWRSRPQIGGCLRKVKSLRIRDMQADISWDQAAELPTGRTDAFECQPVDSPVTWAIRRQRSRSRVSAGQFDCPMRGLRTRRRRCGGWGRCSVVPGRATARGDKSGQH